VVIKWAKQYSLWDGRRFRMAMDGRVWEFEGEEGRRDVVLQYM